MGVGKVSVSKGWEREIERDRERERESESESENESERPILSVYERAKRPKEWAREHVTGRRRSGFNQLCGRMSRDDYAAG